MYLEAVMKQVEGGTWRARSSELRDALRGQNGVNSEIHSLAVIVRVWRCTWRPRSSELRNALAGYDCARLEENLEAVDLEGGLMVAETVFIGELVIVGT
jgi:hypothetical protein